MNKKIARQISKLILKKSSSYLKISIGLFILSLVLISTASVFFINQYLQLNKDFIRNDNTHMIEITSKREGNTQIQFLTFQDEDKVKEAISKHLPNVKFQLYKLYQLSFGVQDENGNTYFIYGLDEGAARLLGNCHLEVNTTCARKTIKQRSVLKIPVIDVQEGGFSSQQNVDFPVANQGGVFERNPFTLYEGDEVISDTGILYVGSHTFEKMIEIAFHVRWDEFVKKYDQDNPFDIQVLKNMYIYVDKITDVEAAARLLNDLGYNTRYTFKAFDNFTGSMKNTAILASLLALVILLITATHVILSFNSYLKVQQRDMGILKQYGYSNESVQEIYSYNINHIFFKVIAVIISYTILVGLLLVPLHSIGYLIFLVIFLLLILLLINRVIVHIILKKYTSKGIIELLKMNKEFE